jgi:hypothetical protein
MISYNKILCDDCNKILFVISIQKINSIDCSSALCSECKLKRIQNKPYFKTAYDLLLEQEIKEK